MRAKRSVLRACRRVLKPGGRLAYYTIYAPPDLSDADCRYAAKIGVIPASGRRAQREMLETAGFVSVEDQDVTAEYGVTARRWMEGREQYADRLRMSMGEAALAERLQDDRAQLKAIDEGLLRCSLLTARRRS